ncbi:chemotaxis protein CheW [Roseateles sp.]|uniref:chemotaxis protein CheW n=1 Tax=Roseateles sp. TaxID=1971397 RepID=UPI003BA46B24
MSKSHALRELQQRLAQRMQAARDQQTQLANWLAVECAGYGLLLSLKEAAEIFTPVAIKPVPYSQPWLAGVANLRGGLFTVIDLAVFLGLRDGNARQDARLDPGQARLVAFNPDLNINCALLVDRLVGLRADEQLQLEPPQPAELLPGARPRFAGARMRDADGRSWQQLHLDALSKHEQFLQVVV